MTPALYRKERAAEHEERENEERSRIVHHIGPVGTGLFPGWGPKL